MVANKYHKIFICNNGQNKFLKVQVLTTTTIQIYKTHGSLKRDTLKKGKNVLFLWMFQFGEVGGELKKGAMC